MANSNGSYINGRLSLTESHEDRLQKVETNVSDVLVSVAELATHQKYMQNSIDTVSKSILEKLDEVGSKVGSFEARLAPVEVDSAARKTHSDHVKSIVKAGVIALVGALAAGLGKLLFDMVVG